MHFWTVPDPGGFPTMRVIYSNHAAALRDALRHTVERGGMSSLGVLHQGVPSESTLTGTDATAQAGCIRRQLDRLAPLSRAVFVRVALLLGELPESRMERSDARDTRARRAAARRARRQ